jgi:protein-tyrosine phosphatase
MNRPFASKFEIMDHHHESREAVVIHCVAGCGRTGQFIVAWCARAGHLPNDIDPVDWIRARRQCCLETKAQIEAVRRIVERFRK